MKILITGGAGFIGSEIVNTLSMPAESIVVLDALTEQIHGKKSEESYLYKKIADKCQFIKGDIRDYETVKESIKDCDCIIHLAAETGTGQSMYQINQYNEVNIMGTSNIFQAISSTNVKIKKIILASSRSVYGEGKYECPVHGVIYPEARRVSEDSKINPNSLYAFTKYTQEKMVETMCKAMNINYTIFRFQNVYGVGQSLKNPYTGILSIFSTLLLENKQINVFEDGLESRDFINVKDIAEAVIRALDDDRTNGEIINLGSGVGTSVLAIAETLKKMYGSSSEICVTGDFRVGDIAHNIADIQKAKQLLDFNPQVTLEEGLNAFTAWVHGQETDNSGYEKSLDEMEAAGMFVRSN